MCLQVVAVARFSGSATRESTELARRRLAAALQAGERGHVLSVSPCMGHSQDMGPVHPADGIELGIEEQAGKFRLAQYGPLNSLKPRRNEIMLKIRM